MRIWTVARMEIVRMMRSRTFYFLLFVMPFTLILILGNALDDLFGKADREIKAVRVAVVNSDQGVLKEGVRAFLDSPETARLLAPVPAATRAEAESKVRAGEADFGLVIPADFSDLVLRGGEASWEFLYGRDRYKNMTAEHVLETFVSRTNTMQAVHLALGSKAASAMQAMPAADRSDRADSGVRLGSLNKEGGTISAIQYYAAAELIMFLLYGGMLAASSMTREREQHTLARLNALPVPPSVIVGGKVIGQGVLSLIQAAVIIAGTTLLYGVDWGGRWGLLAAVVVLSIVSSMSIALIIASVVKSNKAVISLFQTIIIVMTMLSGGFSPVSGLLEKLGLFTLSHWATDGIQRLMLGADLQQLLLHLTVLGAIAVGLSAVSLGVYRKAGYRE